MGYMTPKTQIFKYPIFGLFLPTFFEQNRSQKSHPQTIFLKHQKKENLNIAKIKSPNLTQTPLLKPIKRDLSDF